MISNRLLKNWKKLEPWAKRQNIEAYRLYDRDIPEFPFIVDLYADYAVVYDKTDPVKDKNKNHLPLLIEALEAGLKIESAKIIVKKRQRQEGVTQYEKLEDRRQFMVVREHEAKLEVNLHDYLDTGLFLDHRPIRQRIFKEVRQWIQSHPVHQPAPSQSNYQVPPPHQERPNVLNLFCYTGSVSVFAALAGAQVTNVDMSATYLEWAKRNFHLNGLDPSEHFFIQEDALAYLGGAAKPIYDIIFLDPPTFSNSKRMQENFEVERDQEFIVTQSMARLKPDGVLYFSNNKRDFRLSEKLLQDYQIKNITEASIPMDCHDKKIHHCFALKWPATQ